MVFSLEAVGTPGGKRSPPKGVRMGHWLGLGIGDGRVRSLFALPPGEVWSSLGGCAWKAQKALTPGPAASLGWGQSGQVGGLGSAGPGPLPRGPVSGQQQGWGGGVSPSPEAWHSAPQGLAGEATKPHSTSWGGRGGASTLCLDPSAGKDLVLLFQTMCPRL